MQEHHYLQVTEVLHPLQGQQVMDQFPQVEVGQRHLEHQEAVRVAKSESGGLYK
jgi:hypothetical protein